MVNTPAAERSLTGIREGVVNIKIPLAEVLGPKNEQELLKLLQSIEMEAKNAKQAEKLKSNNNNVITINKKDDDKTKKPIFELIETSVKQAMAVCKNNSNILPANLSGTNRRVIGALMLRINEDEINASNSPYVYEIFQKAITNQISDPLKVLTPQELKFVQSTNESLHRKIVDVLTDEATKIGIGWDTINNFKQEASAPPLTISGLTGNRVELNHPLTDEEIRTQGIRDLSQEYHRELGNIQQHFTEPETAALAQAFFSDTLFTRYLEESVHEIRAGNDGITDAELGKQASKKIEKDLVLLFSKLYRKIDRERPKEFFDEIVRQGFYNSIESVYNNLKNALHSRMEDVSRKDISGTLPEELRGLKFFRKYSYERYHEEQVTDENGRVIKETFKKRTLPSPANEKVSLRDYLESVEVQIDREVDTRKYLHNVRALFFRPAGENGFWGQLANYANDFPTVDIDTVTLLPDSDIFLTVSRLYKKFLEEDFAIKNWIHDGGMFATDLHNNLTKIEQSIKAMIQRQYGADIGTDIWRIDRAMTMGIALARGVFMTEAEIASWADPGVKQNKGAPPTLISYYTNDNTALNALNPMHFFLRWQAESAQNGPLIFLPVDGYKSKFTNKWSWEDLYNSADNFKASYLKGLEALRPKGTGKRLFIELLPNIGRMGSIFSRKGWRSDNAYEGWLIYGANGQDINHLESWKALENIGFEALLNFADEIKSGVIKPDSISTTDANGRKYSFDERKNLMKQNTQELFKHIYRNYIINPSDRNNAQLVDNGFNAELNRLENLAAFRIDKKISEGEVKKDDRENEILTDMYSQFLHNGLAGVLRNRMPTMILRIDRDRFSEGGESKWKVARRQMGLTGDQFDETMKDMAFVETQVRIKASDAMKNHLEHFNTPGEATLHDIGDINYVLDEEAIDTILRHNLRSLEDRADAEDRVERVKELLRTTYRLYYDNDQYKAVDGFTANNQQIYINYLDDLGDKLRNKSKYFPFSIAVDELDTYFLSYRAAGPSVLRRVLGDTAVMEKDVFTSMMGLFESFRNLATSPSDENFAKLRDPLYKIWKGLDGVHGEYAYEVVHHLAAMAIAYFKKDTDARMLWSKLGTVGKYNSLAARIAGRTTGVWEWDVKDIDKFITLLSDAGILPKERYNSKTSMYEEKDNEITIPLINRKVKLGKKIVKRKPDHMYNAADLRENMGGKWGNILVELINKWGPLFAFFIMYQFISKAFKEATGEGQKG